MTIALPLIYGIDLMGAAMFGSPLPFMVSLPAAGFWLALVTVIALVSSAIPAARAARLVVREVLAYT